MYNETLNYIHNNKVIKKKLVDISVKIDKEYQEHTFKDEQKDNYMSVDELNIFRDKLFNKLPKKVVDYDDMFKYISYFLVDFH